MTFPLKCVVGASVNIKLFIPDAQSETVKQLFTHLANPETEFYVPDLFYIESANILWKYVKAGLYTATDVQADLNDLAQFPLKSVSTVSLMQETTKIAINHNITAYDGCYVALSYQVQAPLLTLDLKLVKALTDSPFDVRSFVDFPV